MRNETTTRGPALLGLVVSLLSTAVPPASAVPKLARTAEYLDRLMVRPYDVGTPMRSTGRNIWLTHPLGWGFRNEVHYVHLNWLEPFAVAIKWRGTEVEPGDATAHAGHVTTSALAATALDLELVEHKFVTDDDVLVAIFRATNRGQKPGVLVVDVTSAMVTNPSTDGIRGSTVCHSIPLELFLQMDGATVIASSLQRVVSLAKGKSVDVRVAMAFARDAAAATANVAPVMAAIDPVAAEERSHGRWFLDNVPQIDVPDPFVEKAYAFRWEVVRRNTMDPQWGLLRHRAFSEGRWRGTWYPRVITYGAPPQLREVRWLRDPSYARGHVLTLIDNQRADGAFVGARVDTPATEYTDWVAASIWQVFLVTGDVDLLERALESMRCNVSYVLGRDTDHDFLPVVADHFQTGMEWQPAFFYFSDYDTTSSTPLERVDYAAALYGNATAAAAAAGVVCKPEAASAMAAVAAAVRASANTLMWDKTTHFYYSLRAADDVKAMAREIVGFYPFAFEMAPPEHDRALAKLVNADEFWSIWPVASSAASCPGTSQSGWPIGPGGSPAMWNGPVWPHALSLAADAAAVTMRRSGEAFVTRAQLYEMFRTYTLANFSCLGQDHCDPSQPRDISHPIVGEFYHGDYGYWRTGERDYFHSTYADWLFTLVFGLQPRADATVRVDPLLPPGVWDRFMLERAPYRGHEITIVWDEPGGPEYYKDGREGLDLYIDGTLAASRRDLGVVEAQLPTTVLLAVADGAGGVRLVRSTRRASWSVYRATRRDLADAEPLGGGPHVGEIAVDRTPPADSVYYRADGCGDGL